MWNLCKNSKNKIKFTAEEGKKRRVNMERGKVGMEKRRLAGITIVRAYIPKGRNPKQWMNYVTNLTLNL